MVSGAGALGYSLDMDGQYKNEVELILKYRDMSQMSDCEIAIDNIVNDAIVVDDILPSVSVVLDKTNLTEGIKKKVRTEFETVLDLLNFNNYGHDIFRRWYIEGRLYYHIMIDENDPKRGIVELRSLDATKVKKVKNVKVEKTKDHTNRIKLTKDVILDLKYPKIDSMNELDNASQVDMVFGIVMDCIDKIYEGEETHNVSDYKKEELMEFLDSLNTEQFKEIFSKNI